MPNEGFGLDGLSVFVQVFQIYYLVFAWALQNVSVCGLNVFIPELSCAAFQDRAIAATWGQERGRDCWTLTLFITVTF